MARPCKCPRRRGGGLHLRPRKSKKSRRTIKLLAPLVAELHEHRDEQLAERKRNGTIWRGREHRDLVFSEVDGTPIDSRRDWQAWKDLLPAAGVRDSRVHDARHTMATLLLAQKVPARVVQEVWGTRTSGSRWGRTPTWCRSCSRSRPTRSAGRCGIEMATQMAPTTSEDRHFEPRLPKLLPTLPSTRTVPTSPGGKPARRVGAAAGRPNPALAHPHVRLSYPTPRHSPTPPRPLPLVLVLVAGVNGDRELIPSGTCQRR
jgi:Phage integrase family